MSWRCNFLNHSQKTSLGTDVIKNMMGINDFRYNCMNLYTKEDRRRKYLWKNG